MITFLEKIFGCFHRWGKWNAGKAQVYTDGNRFPIEALRQSRVCEKCNETEIKAL